MELNNPRTLDEIQVHALVERTLSRYPILKKVYEEGFITELVRRRASPSNNLLFALSQPGHETSDIFWKSTAEDIECLLDEGSLEHFAHDLRKEKEHDLQIVRSELSIAAWVKRRGFSISLEPLTRNGSRCEFRAGTEPPTWWEVKTPRDVGPLAQPEMTDIGSKVVNVRLDQDIDADIRRLLNDIEQPYYLDFDFDADLARTDVAAIVKEIKRRLHAHCHAGGELGVTFEHRGLRVTNVALAAAGVGGIGATLGRGYMFGRENMEMIQKLIRESARQLPRHEAGIVVIDASMSDFLDLRDVCDACYGELVTVFRNGSPFDSHSADGIFRSDARTHISAVAFYEHCPNWGRKFRFSTFHNPFCEKPLSRSIFAANDAQQFWSACEFSKSELRFGDI